MSKSFTLSAAIFTATLAAKAKGTKLKDHAAVLVSVGAAPSVDAFLAAYELKYVAEAVTVSLKSITIPPKTGAKGIKAFATAVAKHNEANPEAPHCAAVKPDGTLYLQALPKPRAKRSSTGVPSSKSSVSGVTVAEKCCEADGYTFRPEPNPAGGKRLFFIDDEQVEGSLIQALFARCPSEESATRIMLRKGNRKVTGE